MWKAISEFARKIAGLIQRIERLEDFQKETREDLKKLNDRVDRLGERMSRILWELQRQREGAESERRILLLELDNRLLRMERGLPPAPPSDSDSPPDPPRIPE